MKKFLYAILLLTVLGGAAFAQPSKVAKYTFSNDAATQLKELAANPMMQ